MESKLFGAILLAWLWLVTGSPFHPRTFIPDKEIKKASYIKHYTQALYDSEILKQHRARTRRDSLSITKGVGATLNINLNALDRIFKMKLVRDTSIFHDDAQFEMSNGRSISFDPFHVYIGSLEDDETSMVHGIITRDGLFDGTVITAADEVYIEPITRYSHLLRANPISIDHNYHHHTIAYRSSDVTIPSNVPSLSCISERPVDNESLNLIQTGLNETTMSDVNQFVDLDQNDDDYSSPILELFPRDANHYTVELLDKLYRERYSQILKKQTSIDPKKTTCMLYLQADHTFFDHYKSEEACIEVMTRHVQRVNSIYRYTDFNQDGHPDNISFMIKRVKIHGPESFDDPSYRFTGKFGVEEYLEIFSEENYDAFCLSYMFTYRDFEKGTLGLAWTGDLKNAGGVCEKNGHYRGSMKSLNTGIITLLNYGKHVPPAVSHVTLAHEIGHNFGSPHDPDKCSPGGEDGNFIMFARATSGDKRNNNHFSPCSLISINPVLNFKARSIKGCFAEHQIAICGNGVVEEGEECDCGWEEDCNDPCCHPQRLHHAPFEIPCRLTEDAVCSPSQGPCCTAECSLRTGTKCRDDNGCRDASFCDGRGPQCPPSVNKPNKTICNEEFVCYMGECTGSICLAYGLESCQCTAKSNDPPTKTCELCCKLPGEDQPCISSFDWDTPPYEIPGMMSKPGTPCNDYNGYCDIFQRCREVDPTGPLATLRRLLLSDASLERFQRWMTDRWYAVALGILLATTGLIIVTRLLSKRADTNLKIVYMSNNTRKEIPKRSDDRSLGAVNGLKNISQIKRRIVEAMKTIASPRKTNDLAPIPSDLGIYGHISGQLALAGNLNQHNVLYQKSSTVLCPKHCYYNNNNNSRKELIEKFSNNHSLKNEFFSIQRNWPYVKFIGKFYHKKTFDVRQKILKNSSEMCSNIARIKNNSGDNNSKLIASEFPRMHNRIADLHTLLRNS